MSDPKRDKLIQQYHEAMYRYLYESPPHPILLVGGPYQRYWYVEKWTEYLSGELEQRFPEVVWMGDVFRTAKTLDVYDTDGADAAMLFKLTWG